jgi:hypothetical protein
MREPGFWKQGRLDASSKIQILLQGTLLRPGQVIKAEADQRIRGQPLALDRFMANLAQSKRPEIHTG